MRGINGVVGAVLGLSALVACGHEQPVQHIDNGALVKLNEQQMAPVDDARVEEGRARDNVARARAGVQDARAKIDIAKAEREVAAAQAKRAKAEHDMLVAQKADLKDIERSQADFALAQDRLHAVDLKLEYLGRAEAIAEMDTHVAEQHAEVSAANTERAKFQALKTANSNEVRDLNQASVEARLAGAQAHEAQLRKEAADARVSMVDSYNKWQALDAKVHSAPAPAPMQAAAPPQYAAPAPAPAPAYAPPVQVAPAQAPNDQSAQPPMPSEPLPAAPLTH